MATNKNSKVTLNKKNTKKPDNKKRNIIIIAALCVVAIALILAITLGGGSKAGADGTEIKTANTFIAKLLRNFMRNL